MATTVSTSTAATEATPCATESRLWRECLKTYDYSPDRPLTACDTQRGRYYACLKEWSTRTQGQPYTPQSFTLPAACSAQAEVLHQCMMMHAFETSHCHAAMTQLKRCAARHDAHVRRALRDDAALQTSSDGDDNDDDGVGRGWGVLRRLWWRATGKA